MRKPETVSLHRGPIVHQATSHAEEQHEDPYFFLLLIFGYVACAPYFTTAIGFKLMQTSRIFYSIYILYDHR